MKKRLLSAVLIAALLTGSVISPVPISRAETDPVSIQEENMTEEGSEAVLETSAPSEEQSGQPETEQPETDPSLGGENQLVSPAFERTARVGDVEIMVRAEENVFPADAVLSVTRVSASEEKAQVEAALESERTAGTNVAGSYSFDIKVLDREGNELQPAEGKSVRVSFKAAKIADGNLTTQVYHLKEDAEAGTAGAPLNAEKLEIVPNEAPEAAGNDAVMTATVVTEGFSIYTVEFTYEDKQFVLPGYSTLKLTEILEAVGLSGTVTDWSVTSPELFNIYRGSASGLQYSYDEYFDGRDTYILNEKPVDDPAGDTLYLAALRPFDTEESLDLTIDGIAYHISVTDDYIDFAGSTVVTDKVEQGNTDDDFTETMPIATIFIDEDVIYRGETSRNASVPSILYSGTGYSAFALKNVTLYGGSDAVMLSFDSSKHQLLAGQDNYFDGNIYSAKFTNGAALIDPISGDRTDYDVIITYSNLHINVESDSTGDQLGLFGGNAITLGHTGNYRYGIKVDINIKVVDKSGQLVEGTFYYPMVDLDVDRSTQTSFGNIYGAGLNHANNYSEQVMLTSGLAVGKIWIPGKTGQPYKSRIVEYPEGLLVTATTQAASDADTFYTGFATLADNTSGGISFTYWAANPANNENGIETYLLSGKDHINWKLKSTTDLGGRIQTTRYGNHSGKLDDDSTVYGMSTLTVATGQTVVYTMTPDPGYRLKSVTVNRNTIDINDPATTEVTPVSVDEDNDGIIDYYTFSFDSIKSDGSIHVNWEKTILCITKKTVGTGDVADTFTFTIRAWDPADPSRMVDFTNSTDAASNARFSSQGGGVYQFTLGNNESFNISSEVIPAGWEWEVQEVQSRPGANEYGLANDGWTPIGGTLIGGTLPLDESTQDALFTNKRKKPIPDDHKLTVKKIWVDDIPEIRPEKITVSIEKKPAVGVEATSFRNSIASLVSLNNLTGIRYGSVEGYNAAAASAKTTLAVSSGTGDIYFYKVGNDVFFYCDSEIYLTGSANNLFGTTVSGATSAGRPLRDISGLAKVHTDFITNMEGMFKNCKELTDLSPLSEWNTANVLTMRQMFAAEPTQGDARAQMKIGSLEPLRNWQTQNVTSFEAMFQGGGAGITSVEPLYEWDVSRGTSFRRMFFRTCTLSSAKTLEAWNVGAGRDFAEMFGRTGGSTASQELPDSSLLPDWSKAPSLRAGSWGDGNGTYTATAAARESTSPTNKNDAAKYWAGNNISILSSDEHSVDSIDENVWIYEFEVPNKGSMWSAYETLPASYADKYTTKGGLEGQTLEDGKGLQADQIKNVTEEQTAVIENTRVTRDVVLKVTWDDNNDALGIRPSAMQGSIDYSVDSYNGKLQTVDGWEVSGNVWTKIFKIPYEASVPDWTEALPETYEMTLKAHADGTNVYEFVNAPRTFTLTAEKQTIGEKPGTFSFLIKVFRTLQGDEPDPAANSLDVSCQVLGVDNDAEILSQRLLKFTYHITLTGGEPGSTATGYIHNSDNGSTYVKDESVPYTFTFDSNGEAALDVQLGNNQKFIAEIEADGISYTVTQDPADPYTSTLSGITYDFTTTVDGSEGLSKSGGPIDGTASAAFVNNGERGTTPTCFAAGTLVHTSRGLLPIEDVKPGMKVLSYDSVLRKNRFVSVEETLSRPASSYYVIRAGKEEFRVTAQHRFYLADPDRMAPASQLTEGDLLLTEDRETLAVTSVRFVRDDTTVYNLQAAELHNYYVTETGILTSNMLIARNGQLVMSQNTSLNTRSGNSVNAALTVSQTISTNGDPSGITVHYRLSPVGGAPLPGSDPAAYPFSVQGNASTEVSIPFDTTGVYEYKLSATGSDDSEVQLDDIEYTVVVYVLEESGTLQAYVLIYQPAQGAETIGAKVLESMFTHAAGNEDPFIDPDAFHGSLSLTSRFSNGARRLLNSGLLRSTGTREYLDLSQAPWNLSAGENEGEYRFTLTLPGNASQAFPEIPYGYSYEITEESQSGWTLVSSENTSGTLTDDATATFTNKEGKVVVTKIWEDDENAHGTRPEDLSVTITTTLTDSSTSPATVTEKTYTTEAGGWDQTDDENGEWTYTFVLDDAREVLKTVSETEPEGYDKTAFSVDAAAGTAELTNTLKKNDLTIEKLTGGDPGTFNFKIRIWKDIEETPDPVTTSYIVTNRVIGVSDTSLLYGDTALPFSYTLSLGGGAPGSSYTGYIYTSEDGANYTKIDGRDVLFTFDSNGEVTESFQLAHNQKFELSLDQENITYDIVQTAAQGFRTYVTASTGEEYLDGTQPQEFSDSGTIENGTLTPYLNVGPRADAPPTCFTAGTRVLTKEGAKNIENIRAGDLVLSYDSASGENSFCEVEAVVQGAADRIYVIEAAGRLIEVTGTHSLYSLNRERYTEVQYLRAGEMLRSKDGAPITIDAIHAEDRSAKVYNLQVAENSSYYVTEEGILSYNMNIPGENGISTIRLKAKSTALGNSGPVTVTIPVTQYFTNNATLGPSVVSETFTYQLTATNEGPLPTYAQGNPYTFSMSGNGRTRDLLIPVTEIGEYTYTLENVTEHITGYYYDETVYNITVYAYEGVDGLEVYATIRGQSGDKSASATYSNSYTPGGRFIYVGSANTGRLLNRPLAAPALRSTNTRRVYYELSSASGFTPTGNPGEYSFTLNVPDKSSVTIPDIPYGYQYEITEIVPAGWSLTNTENESGTVEGSDVTARFTNTRAKVVLTKNWEDGSDAFGLRPAELSATITTTLTDNSTSPATVTEKTYTTSAGGWTKSGNAWTYTFLLDSTEEVLSGVSETVPSRYTLSASSVNAANGTASLTNTLESYSLTVTKEISGNAGDKEDTFEFTLQSEALKGKTIKVNGTELTFPAGGICSFTLGHEGSICFSELPYGTDYTVTEVRANQDGYRTSTVLTGDTQTADGSQEEADIQAGSGVGTVSDSLLKADTTVAFTNSRNAAVPTEIRFQWLAWLMLIPAAGGVLLFRFFRRRRTRQSA